MCNNLITLADLFLKNVPENINVYTDVGAQQKAL